MRFWVMQNKIDLSFELFSAIWAAIVTRGFAQIVVVCDFIFDQRRNFFWRKIKNVFKLRQFLFTANLNCLNNNSIRNPIVVSSFWLMTSSKTARVKKQACMSYQVCICATEYRQLTTIGMCANLSELMLITDSCII